MSCSSIAAVLEALAETGATPQMMAAAARRMAEQEESRRAEVREQARIRKQRQRIRERADAKQPVEVEQNASRVTQRDTCDAETPAPLFSPLLPSPKPLTNNPPIIPPSSEIEAPEKSKREPNGTRLSPDWELPEDWLSAARQVAFKAKQPLSDDEIFNEADKFRDHWHSKAGAAGRKVDWRATWRNWVRTYLERRPRARNAPGGYVPASQGQHGRGSIADAALRRYVQRQNGNGVSGGDEQGGHVPADAGVVDGDYRLVG